MDLKQLKNDISNAGFSQEGMLVINNLLGKAEKRGYLEKDEKDELNDIIDIEIEGAQVVADAKKEIAGVLLDFSNGVEDSIGKVIEELEESKKGLAAAPPKPPRPSQP